MIKHPCQLVFFISFCFLVVGLFVGAFLGEPHQISRAFDPDGMPCGGDGLEEFPYAYFTNPDSRYLNKILCISSCPYTDSNGQLTPIKCAPNSLTKSCDQHISISDQSQTMLLYDSFLYKGSMCLPRTLQYYDEIKAGSIPSNSQKIISDLYQARFVVLSVSFISILFSQLMMFLLKKETKTLVWLFTIGVFCFVGGLSIYFSKEFRNSLDYQKLSDNMSTFKVSEQYIDTMTYQPQVLLSGILAGIFIISTLYAAYFLYNNHERISYLTEIFEIVEDFMKDQKNLQEFITYALAGFIAIFALMYYALLYLASCYQINEGVNLLPFEHIKHDIPYYVHFIYYPICFWIITTFIGFLTHLIAINLRRWVYKDNNIQIADIQEEQLVLNYNKQDFQSCLSRINTISYFAFILIFSPLKLIADFFRDWVQGIQIKFIKSIFQYSCCFLCYCYYGFVRNYEEILYLELAYTMTDIKQTEQNVIIFLQLKREDNEEVIEAFERIRNLGEFFILITKLLVALFSAFSCGLIIKIFQIQLIQQNIPCMISALFGFFIASIYFSIYSISVPGLGYIYLRERQIDQDLRKNNNTNQNFELIKENHKILREMMDKFLNENQNANQNQNAG